MLMIVVSASKNEMLDLWPQCGDCSPGYPVVLFIGIEFSQWLQNF